MFWKIIKGRNRREKKAYQTSLGSAMGWSLADCERQERELGGWGREGGGLLVWVGVWVRVWVVGEVEERKP